MYFMAIYRKHKNNYIESILEPKELNILSHTYKQSLKFSKKKYYKLPINWLML